MSRINLTQEDRQIFKLPLQCRKKLSINLMRQWIELTELIFQKPMKKEEKWKIHWYFSQKNDKIKQRKQNLSLEWLYKCLKTTLTLSACSLLTKLLSEIFWSKLIFLTQFRGVKFTVNFWKFCDF